MIGPQDFPYWHPCSAYQATQKQRQIENTVRKLKREREAYKAAGLKEDATAVNVKIRRLNSKYKEFSEAAGLPMQKERMKVTYTDDASIAKAAAKKAASTPQTLANSGRYGIMNTIGKEPIAITDEAIEKVPLVKPSGWSDEQAKNLQSAHKELLQYAQKEPVGTEAAFALDMNGGVISRKTGIIGHVDIPSVNTDHIVIHNHPDNQMFSREDIESFLWRGTTQGITAIGNDGKTLHALFKKDSFDGLNARKAIIEYDEKFESAIAKKDLDKYSELVNVLLKELKDCGIEVV